MMEILGTEGFGSFQGWWKLLGMTLICQKSAHHLEDHPRTRKWLITMVIVSPLSGVGPLPNGLNCLFLGVTNHLLIGMILQAGGEFGFTRTYRAVGLK